MKVNDLFFNHALTEDRGTMDKETLLGTLNASARISGLTTFAIDFDRHERIFCTDRQIYMNESSEMDLFRECENPYWSIISEETLQKLLLIRNNYLLPGKELTEEEYSNHVCIINYPILVRNHEIFITQKFTPLVMRSDGITRIGMFTINPSNKKSVDCSIFTSSSKSFHFDFWKKSFVEDNGIMELSETEKAILLRVKMGMTNKEIAENLIISVPTVKTHRMRIFKKLGVKTINEALAVCDNYQLL